MLNSYRRRAFILITFAALEQTTAHAHAAASEPDSLWDILARAKSLTVTNPQQSRNNSPFSTEQPARQSLGPVPGFSLPAAHAQEPSIDSVFNKKKPKRSAGFFGSVGDWFNRLQASTGSKIQATGHHTFSLRVDSISGGASATEGFQNEQYFGRGSNGLYSDTDMTIDATLFKHLHYSARISNNLFSNPNDNRVKLDYNTKKLRVEWGDINAGFQGNSLIDFNRYLSGMKVTNEWSRQFRTSLIYSQTKAETRSLQFPGNGSSGPYLAFLGQVVEGSDHVRVDNRDMVKGQDYTLDSYTGELRFLNGNIVLPSSTIAITFETLGYNISRGNIYGVRTEFSPKGSSRVGMTFVTQNSKGSQGLQTHTQDFYGLGTSPYALDQVPDPTKPITLTVDGIPQIQGIDFVVDPQRQNLIHLTQIVIGTSHLIKITYFPYNNTPTPGNRSVLGFDGNVPLGKLGSISLESAFSGLNLQGNDIGGNAWQIRADLNPARNLRSTINLRNISPTFSSIQSPGFSRNEKAIEFSSDYNPTKNLHLNLNWQKAKRPAYTSSVGTGLYTISTSGFDDYDQYGLGLSYALGRNASINFSRSSLATNYIQGGKNDNLNDSLGLNYTLRALTFDISLSRNQSSAFGQGVFGTTSSTTSTQTGYNSSTFSKRLGLRWQATKWLDLTGTLSDNDINSTGLGTATSSRTNARDTQLAANLNLIRNLRLRYSYDLSDTGNIPSSTTTTTTTTGTGTSILPPTRQSSIGTGSGSGLLGGGSGYGGSGYTQGLGGLGNYSGYYGNSFNQGYYGSYGGRSATHRMSLEYSPRHDMQTGIQVDRSSSTGSYLYNSTRNNLGFNFSWQPSDRIQLNTIYSVQKVAYNGSIGGSDNNTLLFSLNGRPFGGKMGVRLDWQSMRSKSAINVAASTGATTGTGTLTDTSTNLSSMSLRLDYPFTDRYMVFLEALNSNAAGYFGSTESNFRFGLDFALNRVLKFSLGWQLFSRKNKDSSSQNSSNFDYKGSSLIAELGFNFGFR